MWPKEGRMYLMEWKCWFGLPGLHAEGTTHKHTTLNSVTVAVVCKYLACTCATIFLDGQMDCCSKNDPTTTT